MGKTPAKWFKTLLLGKKSPKPKLSKDKDVLNPAYIGGREILVSSNARPAGLTENPPLPITKANGSNKVDQEEVVADGVPNVETPSSIKNADENLLLQAHSLEDHEKVRLHEAATKAQAAYRGYLARRAFRTLKGIVRLQAVIRGHLVRRQANATLYCLRTIVKLQAMIRSRKDSQCATPLMKCEVELKHVYIQKLLAPSRSAMPLHLQYAPGDPNSAWEWVERWTKSRFWDPPPPVQPPKKISQTKQKTAEIDQSRPKRSARKLPSSSDKVKRHGGKASGTVQENPQNANGKPKVNLRKTVKVVELDTKKSNQNSEKTLDAPACDEVVGEDSVETMNRNKSLEPPRGLLDDDLADEVHDLFLADIGKELNGEDASMSNENQQISNRRVSLPAKMENGTNSSTPRRPSYMAPTQSAKAKLRAQGSPSLTPDDDDAEKNGYTRRHSLPSNGKVTSFSPRAHRLVEASSKGAIKTSDKSLSSSRDCSDKATKGEWKR